VTKPRTAARQWTALSTDDVLGGLGAAPGFLGRFTAAELRDALGSAGVLDGLRDLGYVRVRVRVDEVEGEHRLLVAPERSRTLLVDLRLAEEARAPDEPWMGALGSGALSFLTVRWLALQHPKGAFTPARPRLPGQRYPGLGLGRKMYALLRSWARAWGKDALLNQPGYFHNALFYAETFRFLSAEREGRFQALRRDLAHLTPAEASWAVERGRVQQEDGDSGEVVRLVWEPAPMIDPHSSSLGRALDGDEYVRAARRARERFRYLVSRRSPPHSSQGQSSRR
jgi:hypothetical protein